MLYYFTEQIYRIYPGEPGAIKECLMNEPLNANSSIIAASNKHIKSELQSGATKYEICIYAPTRKRFFEKHRNHNDCKLFLRHLETPCCAH